MKVFRRLNRKQIEKEIEKAKKLYEKTSYKKPDKIIVGEIKLPRIVTPDGKVIDLEEKYKGCCVILTCIGGLPYLPYFSDKAGYPGDKQQSESLFLHFLENPAYLVCDSDDTSRIFIMHSSLKLTDRGIEG